MKTTAAKRRAASALREMIAAARKYVEAEQIIVTATEVDQNDGRPERRSRKKPEREAEQPCATSQK